MIKDESDARLRVLSLEDSPQDFEIIRELLAAAGFETEMDRVETEKDFTAQLENREYDIILADFKLPEFDVFTALRLTIEKRPELPFICVSGSIGEETAIELIKKGAVDYIRKDRPERLPIAVKRALAEAKEKKGRIRAEKALRENEELFRNSFKYHAAITLFIDPDTGNIIDANNAAVDFYRWPYEQLSSMNIAEINTLSPEEIKQAMEKVKNGQQTVFELRHRRADGSIRDVEVFSSKIEAKGKILLHSIIHDITERKQAQAERDALSSRLSHYLSTSPTITYSIILKKGEAQWLWVSENIRNILGYSVAEALHPDWWLKNIHSADRYKALEGIVRLTKSGSFVLEYRFFTKDKTIVWLRDEMRLVHTQRGGSEIVGTLTNISMQKSAEEELSLKSAALESMANAILITDRDGTIRWLNTAFSNLTGYSKDEVLGKNTRSLFNSGKQDRQFFSNMWDTILSGNVWYGELTNKKKSGDLYVEEMTITPVKNESGRINHFIAVKSDISARKAMQERLESSLKEKEVLLREIHHRVKNNMQVIISLLNLSTENISDQVTNDIISDIKRRIQSMAIIHEQFYETDDLARIDFSLFLRQIVSGLHEEFRGTLPSMTVTCEVEEAFLPLDKAIPAGLIVSELLTNSFKYAFPSSGKSGTIRVFQRKIDTGILEITVNDDGIGLPAHIDPKRNEGLGMLLIRELSKQIGGGVLFKYDGGTTAELRFPME